MRYRFGDFELDTDCYELRLMDREITLPRRPFDLLVCLVRYRQRVVLKDEIIAAVWTDCCVCDATLTHCVMQVRRALGDDVAAPRFIRTLRRRGYRFVAAVEELPPASAHASEQAR